MPLKPHFLRTLSHGVGLYICDFPTKGSRKATAADKDYYSDEVGDLIEDELDERLEETKERYGRAVAEAVIFDAFEDRDPAHPSDKNKVIIHVGVELRDKKGGLITKIHLTERKGDQAEVGSCNLDCLAK